MLDFIISINKLSLVAFLITLGYLIYEIYLLKKEKKSKKAPSIPQFKENLAPQMIRTTVILSQKEDKESKADPKILWILFILLSGFALLTIVGFFYRSTLKEQSISLTPPPSPVIEKKVESSGIFIYDKNFNLLDEKDWKNLSSGSSIIIGIKTIPQADIDKARLRVNKNFWEITDETKKFDKKNQIFYINYKIPSETPHLKIEAQLHSKTEGWLGE